MRDLKVEPFRAAIVRSLPELSGSKITILATGWHSAAIEADGRLIFKFPRDEVAQKALVKEARLLARIRPRVTIAVPDLRIHEGPPVFSSHTKLQGEHLLPAGYLGLRERARSRLGHDLARLYAQLHQLDMHEMRTAGAGPIEAWQRPEAIRAKALPALPSDLRIYAKETILAFERLPPDPHGCTYGFFDGHGWNMAFDYRRSRLNGIFDFADSGIGPLHQEFIYSNFISPDLTERIVSAYESRTGRSLDRRRISILTGFHRLSELAALADDPEHAPDMVRHFKEWVGMTKTAG